MIRKRLGKLWLAIFLVVGATNILHAQSIPSGWVTYSIHGVCSFAIPNTMEVRLENSFHSRFVKSVHQSSFYEMLCNECDLFLEEAKLVLQPKGLNEDPFSDDYRNANKSYGRIIINFSYDDFLLQEDVRELAPSELTVLDTLWRNRMKEGLECMDKCASFKGSFTWYPFRKENFCGLSALVEEYNRPGTDIETHVRCHIFFYDGKCLKVTTSYNLKHEEKYKDDFKTFMQLLKIETEEDRPSLGSKGLFKSDEYHISFAYDSKRFSEVKKQNNSSHCFFKLESSDGATILLSAWDLEDSTDDFSIHEDEVVEEMKQQDKTTLKNIVKSCDKVSIGHIKALKSMAINNVYGTKYVYTTYRLFYKNRFYTIDFHIPESIYNKDKSIVDELIKGLKFN